MDYRKIYKDLCDRGQLRKREEGKLYERHHIKPKSFGGTYENKNMTLLTLKEHYIAHLLLVAIYPESPAMHSALWNMCNITPKNNIGYERYKPGARTFERIRGEYAKFCSIGENNPQHGKPITEKQIETCRQRSLGNTWNRGRKHSEEVRKRMSEGSKKVVLSEENKKKALENLAKGGEGRVKYIICTKTGKRFRGTKELSEFLKMKYNTVNNWFIGKGRKPEWFHYEREIKIGRSVPFHQMEGYKETKIYE